MICDPLPRTGLGAHVDVLLLLAIACLVTGTTLVLMARRSQRGPAVLLLLLAGVVITISSLGVETPAQAATTGCSSSAPPASSPSGSPSSSLSSSAASSVGHLTITQTSTMTGLAPGVAPAPITGRVVNDGAGGTHVTAVDVEIAYIVPRPNSSAGACGASDYKLIATRMPVGRTLGPGGSTGFGGASIGFDNKKTNQDACKGVAIHLLYTVNPTCTLVPHHDRSCLP